jgi:hypothetical protein
MELSDQAFAILRAAVNVAKSEQIQSVKALHSRLLRAFPNHEDDVDSAIRCWASYAK